MRQKKLLSHFPKKKSNRKRTNFLHASLLRMNVNKPEVVNAMVKYCLSQPQDGQQNILVMCHDANMGALIVEKLLAAGIPETQICCRTIQQSRFNLISDAEVLGKLEDVPTHLILAFSYLGYFGLSTLFHAYLLEPEKLRHVFVFTPFKNFTSPLEQYRCTWHKGHLYADKTAKSVQRLLDAGFPI